MQKEILDVKTNCHSGLDPEPKATPYGGSEERGMSDSEQSHNEMLNQVQHDGIGSESGRSMVEMLGVLAIIGVLSVMGIAGYKAAMTRHRANELLNEASKRAVVVAGQISLMGHAPSLSEFNEKDFSGGSFELTVYGASGTAPWTNADTDKKFTLSITGVEESICEQMKGAAEDNAVIQGFAPTTCDTGNDNNVKLTYNNDLGTDNVPSGDDNQTEEEGGCPANRQCGDICCGEGHTCQNGQCCKDDSCCPVGSMGLNIDWDCCSVGEVLVLAGGDNYCCPSGSVGLSTYSGDCCNSDEVVMTDNSGETHCCPAGTTSFDGGFCCGANGSVLFYDGFENYVCCPEGSVGITEERECCLAGNVMVPDARPGYSLHCCPEGYTSWTGDYGCCPEGSIGLHDEYNGSSYCCPSGSVRLYNGTCYDANNQVVPW